MAEADLGAEAEAALGAEAEAARSWHEPGLGAEAEAALGAEAEAAVGAAVLQEALAEGPVSSSDDGSAGTRAAEEGLTAARSCSPSEEGSEEGNTAFLMGAHAPQADAVN